MNLVKTTLLLGLLTGLIVLCGAAMGGRSGMVVALVIAAAMNLGSYWFSDKLVLARYHARAVTPEEAPRLHAIVGRLAERMGIPKPKLYVLPEEAPNAFATGRNPSHAAVAATEGLLRLMDDAELEGVLAHELGHVRNRDILVSSIAATIAGAIMVLASMARWGALLGGFGGRDERNGGNALGMLLAAIFAPVAALLVQMAISRSREYAADATGAELTGRPEALASALGKLGAASTRIAMDASPATSHLFIVKPRTTVSFASLFSTHPPLEERIRRLQAR